MRLLILRFALLASVAPACKEAPRRCFVGDTTLAAEIEPVFRDEDGAMRPMSDGSEVPLILPPQGGKVMFVGVRARNLDGCPVTISTSIRDVCSGAVVALERRPVELTPTGDGWLAPLQPSELTNYSNLPACPRANLDRDIHGEPHLLTIRIEDKEGRMAEQTLQIVPTCAEPAYLDRCLCECSAAYRLGDDCGGERPDAGSSGSCDAG